MMTWISRCSRLGAVAGGLVFCGSAGFAQAAPPPAGWPAQIQGIPDSLGVSLHLRGKLDPADYSVATPIEQADLERQLDQMAALGLKIVRTDIAYRWTDKDKTAYDFTDHRRVVAACQKRGLRVLTILSLWDTRHEKTLGFQTAPGRQTFAAFCGQAAAEFKGQGILWEMWNEPNLGAFWNPKADPAGYTAAVKGAIKAMRQADPACVIVAPSPCTMDYVFLAACFKEGLLADLSAVSLHPYSDTPETQIARYLQLRNLMTSYGGAATLPIVCTEWGFSELFVGQGTRIRPPDEQAALVVRSILADQLAGLPMHILYTNYDYDDQKTSNESCFGLIKSDRTTPKASYHAVRTLIQQLSGLKFKGQLLAGSAALFEVAAGAYVAMFTGAGKTVAVVWTSGAAHEAKVQLPPGQPTSMVDMKGTVLPLPPVVDPGPAQYVKLELKPAPVYIQMQTSPDGGIGVGTK